MHWACPGQYSTGRLEPMTKPVFAADRATGNYYDRRASEYDDWYTGKLFLNVTGPVGDVEVERVVQLVHSLRTLDAACGSAFFDQASPWCHA